MPHKHTRPRDGDQQEFNLAPSKIAKPLPAFEKSTKPVQKGKKGRAPTPKRKRDNSGDYKEDDTPKAFARLMQMQSGQKLRSGLDDGGGRKKKRKMEADSKKANTTSEPSKSASEKAEPLKIMPGERMSDFAARVNQALPMGGLSRKAKSVEGVRERQTKTEKRLKKMYAEWRVEEARRKERLDELQEQQEEDDDEKEAELGGQQVNFTNTSRKAKRKRMVGEVDDDDDDPWAILKTKRDAPKGLNDVVQEPPTLKPIQEKFKVRNGAKVDVSNVPGTAGSLKRREELGEARKEVIERYRAMMKGGGKT